MSTKAERRRKKQETRERKLFHRYYKVLISLLGMAVVRRETPR